MLAIPTSLYQKDVLDLITQGYTDVEIAKRLGHSRDSVHAATNYLYERYHLKNAPKNLNRRVLLTLMYHTINNDLTQHILESHESETVQQWMANR